MYRAYQERVAREIQQRHHDDRKIIAWNNIIVDLFSFAKPARTIWQILGLMIFWTLVK